MRRRNLYACMLLSAFLGVNAAAPAMAQTTTAESSSEEASSIDDAALEAVADKEENPSELDEDFLVSDAANENEDNQISGTIEEIGTNTITIRPGMGQGMANGGSAPEMPGNGGMSENGSAPEKPGDENMSDDGSAPEKPSDENLGVDGSAPEKPSGEDMSDDGSAPEKPSGEDMSDNDSAPEKPSGEDMSDNDSAPEKPSDGSMGEGGFAPEMPGGESVEVKVTDSTVYEDADGNEISLDDLSVDDYVTVELDDNGNASKICISEAPSAQMGMPGGGMGGGSSKPESYDTLNEYSEDTEVDSSDFVSTGTDENAILVDNGANVSLSNITVDKSSDDSTGGDNSSFYGVGAAILVTDGTATISNAEITTDSKGGAGVFAYGDGVVEISDSTITTTQDTSGGIHVAGGGTLSASNLTVETNGESSAAVRSDRGGGTMTVDGGSYTSNGTGSPAVYCTADISITDAELTATGSEAVCIEGLNSLALTNCTLEGNIPENEQNDCNWTVILYQSMSGDSEVGNSSFTMNGGSLISKNGGIFYTTNTESTFYISGVDLTYSDSNEFLLKCTGNSNTRGWGSAGANGADCSFTADAQEMAGSIIWDSISTLDVTLQDGSVWTGDFVQDESNAGNGGNGTASLAISADSTWIVTGNSVLTTLTNNGTIVDSDGNTVTICTTDGTVLSEGTSDYTITVSEYIAE